MVWIRGEVSNFKHHSSGHMYFSLKDDRAQIKSAFFRNSTCTSNFRPEDGLRCWLRGRLSLYEPRGDYQVIVEYMEPVGSARCSWRLTSSRKSCVTRGFLTRGAKGACAAAGQIGVVTSPTGAALHDMLRILGRRNGLAARADISRARSGCRGRRRDCSRCTLFQQPERHRRGHRRTRRRLDRDLWAFNERKSHGRSLTRASR